MTVPSAGNAEVRIVPDFSEFGGEVAHGIEAALQVAKNEVRNAFAALFRTVMDKSVFDPMKKQAIPFVSGVGADLAQSFANSFTRSMIDQMPGKFGRAFSSALTQGGEGAAETAGGKLATAVSDAFSKPLGERLGQAAVKAMVGLYKAWTTASDWVKKTWTSVMEFLDSHGILGAVRKAGTSVGNALMSAWQASINKIRDWGSSVLPRVRELGERIVSGLSEAWGRIKPVFASAIDKLREVGGNLLPMAKELGQRIVTGLQSAWANIQPAFASAIDKLKDVARQVIPIGKMIGERVMEGLKLAWTTFRPYAQQFLSGLSEAFGGLGSALRQLGSTMAQRIATAFQSASADVGRPAMQAVSEGMRREGPRVAQATGQVGEQAAGMLQTRFQRFMRGGQITPDDLFRGGSEGYQSGLGNLGRMFGRRFATETGTGVATQAATGAHVAALERTWHPGAVDTAIISAARAAGRFVETVGTWIGRGVRLIARPAQKMAQAMGEPFYRVTNDTLGVLGNLLLRVMPEKWRDAAYRSMLAFKNTIGPPVMTALGIAAAGALVYGLYRGSRAVASFVGEVYLTISKGLLKLGQLGLQAGTALVKGIGQGLAGMGKIVADAIGILGRGLANVGKMAATAAGTITAAVAGVGATAIKAGMDFNVLSSRAFSAFRTVLGSAEAADKMMADIREFASTSPFPRQNFIEAAQLMTSFGIESQKVIPYLDAIQNATAAMGFSAEKINEITFVLAQIQAAGKITATDLMQLGQRGINAAELIGDSMGKTGVQIKEEITAGTLDATEALDALAEGMSKRFAGAAQGVRETWVGATDRIKGALRDIGSALVEPFIGQRGGGMAVAWANELADLLRALQKLIEPLATAFISKMTPQLAKISPLLTKATEAIGKLDLSKLMDGFSTLGPLIGAAGTALTVFAGRNLLGGIPIIGDFMGKFNPLITGLIALIALSPELQQGIGAIVSGPLKQMGNLFGQFMPLFQQLSQILTGVLMDAISGLMPVVLAVVEQIAKLAPVLVDTLQAVAEAFGPMARTIGTVLADVFNAFGPAIGTVLTAVAQLAGPIGQVIGVIARVFGDLLSSLGPAFTRIVDAIATTMAELLPKIIPIIRDLGRMFTDLVRGIAPIITRLIPVIGEVFAALIPIIRPIIDTLSQVFSAIGPVITDVAKSLGTALVDALKAIQPSLDVILPAIANLAETFFPMLGRVIEKLAPLLPTIAEAFGKVAEFLVQLISDVLSSPAWEAFVDMIAEIAKELLPLLAPLVLELLEPFKMLVPPLMDLAMALFPAIALIIKAILPLLPALIDFITGIAVMFVQLADALVPLISALLPPLVGLIELIMVAIEPLIPLVGLLIRAFGPGLLTIIAQLLGIVLSLVSTALTPLLKLLTMILTPVMKLVTGAANLIGTVFGPSGVFGWIGRGLQIAAEWLGKLPAMVGRVFQPLVNFGKQVARFLQPAIDVIISIVKWILGGSPGLIPAIKALGDIAGKVFGFIKDIITTVWNTVLEPIFTTMWTIIKKVAGFYWWFYSNVIKIVWNLIKRAFQIGWAILKPIFGFLINIIKRVGKFYWDFYSKIIKVAWDLIKKAFRIGWQVIKRVFGFVIDIVKRVGKFYWDFYTGVIKVVWNLIKTAFRGGWNLIKRIFGFVIDIVKRVGQFYWDFYRTVIKAVWDLIKKAFRAGWDVIKRIFNFIKDAIDAVGGVFQWLWNKVFSPLWDKIRGAWSRGWDVIRPIADAFKTSIDAIKTAFRAMWEGIKWAWDKIAGLIKRVWDNTIGKVLGAFQDMPGKIKTGFEKLRDGLSTIMGKIRDFIKRPIVFVIDKIIGTLIRGINTLLRAVRIPEIPTGWIDAVKGMREGGRVPGGWGGGDRVPIMAEPGEWVLTKRQAKAIGYGNLGNLPHYQEGGMVGSNVRSGYFDNGPDVGLNPAPRWGLPSWANPVNWGKGVVKVGQGLWELGKDLVNKASGLLRFAAAKAFEVMTAPLLKMAKGFRDDENANQFRRIMGGLMVNAIEGARKFIWGKSEDAPEPEAIGVAAAVVEAAKSRLGMPYVWAAKGPTAFDCSGLVQWSYAQAGIKGIGPNTREQITKGRKVGKPLIPADLIFWGNPPTPAGVYHVALSLGGNKLIEAPEPGRNVSTRDIYGRPSMFRRIIAESTVAGATGQGGWAGVVRTVLERMGQTQSISDAVGGIMAILNPESTGNPKALNARDVNWRKGTPSVGLMQMITSNMRAYKPRWGSTDTTPTLLRDRYNGRTFTVPAWMVDPATNIGAAVNYMKNRYGSVMGALRFRQRNNWYDQGGWLPPGVTTVLNATGRPEPVLSPQQWDAISGRSAGVEVVEVEVERGPMVLSGGTLSITPDGAGGLRAWIQDMVLDEVAMDGTVSRMGGGSW